MMFNDFPRRGFYMSKIPKCRLETYWANKEVLTCPKSQNVVWKPARASEKFCTCPKSSNVVWKPARANKEVFTCPKSQNVVWKPTGLTKRTFLFYGPMAPGAHRAHIFLINVSIYFSNLYFYLIVYTFSQISKNSICSKKCHINDLEQSFSATFSESRCASFPC